MFIEIFNTSYLLEISIALVNTEAILMLIVRSLRTSLMVLFQGQILRLSYDSVLFHSIEYRNEYFAA